MAEILRHSAFLGWVGEHFEGDSRFYTTLYVELEGEYGDGHFTAVMLLTTKACAAEICDNVTNFPIMTM